LADHDLHGLGKLQMVGVEPVARRKHLIDHHVDGLALLAAHAAVAGRRGDARPLGGEAERGLGVRRERAVAHAGDRDRPLEAHRIGAVAAAELDLGRALLAVALERHTRERAGDEREVVEGRHTRAPHRETLDVVTPELSLQLDLVDHGAWPHRGLTLVVHQLGERRGV